MKRLVPVVLLAGWILTAVAAAAGDAPAPVLPDSLHWVSPPNIPGLEAAWVIGQEQKLGPYILRVRIAAGGRIPPHTHPDERNSTVLAGTIYVGFGEAFDEKKIVAIPAGAVVVVPAGVPHYVWARDGEAMYQEAGVGPTGTSFIE
jgi:quercetin dioxygenase-like cupin family protein